MSGAYGRNIFRSQSTWHKKGKDSCHSEQQLSYMSAYFFTEHDSLEVDSQIAQSDAFIVEKSVELSLEAVALF